MRFGLGLNRQRISFRLLLIAIVGLMAVVAGDAQVSAASFRVSWSASLDDPAPGAASDIIIELSIPAPDMNFSKLIAFIPPEFGIADGDEVPDGAFAGRVTAAASLGLIGNACNSGLSLAVQMMDATTDPAYPIPPYYGTTDGNGNGLPDNVDYYPMPMALIAPNVQPLQRLYGQVSVAGTLVPLNFVIFAPGTQIPLVPAFDDSLGYPMVTIVGDPFAVPETSFPITDFCTPLSTRVVLNGVSADNPILPGNQAGVTLHTNPQGAGVYNSVVFARSQWDADGDGAENNIDPCPLTADPGWDPRADGGPGDADGDDLPDSCDPSAAAVFDSDGDQYPNRGDYCPLVAAQWIHWDRDRDAIGDECDPFPEDETNGGAARREQLCVADTLVVGSPASMDLPPWSCPNGPDVQVPPRIDVYPKDGAEMVGTVHSIRVNVSKPGIGAGAAAGVTVGFSVSGANSAAGSCLTSNWGSCEFNYLGSSAGVDTIVISATVDGIPVEATATNEWLVPPPNDDFGAATLVTDIPYEDEIALAGAGNEKDEPSDCLLAGSTAWYRFTPTEAAFVTIEARSRETPLVLAAYTGSSLADLALVACDTGVFGPLHPAPLHAGGEYYVENYITFSAEKDVTYQIQIGTLDSFFLPEKVKFSIAYAQAGDANCSTDLTALDALEALRVSAALPAAGCAANGDMDCDGGIDAIDALLILRVVVALAQPRQSCVAPQS